MKNFFHTAMRSERNEPDKRKSDQRYAAVDGMRGVAAVSVVFFHLYANVERHAQTWIPGIFDTILRHGYLGVHVFFVISGFVIALSVGKRRIGWRFVARFMARRSVRLDPLYWVSITVALFLIVLSGYFFNDLSDRAFPSVEKIVFNAFYLQNLLGYGDIVSVYWTLCLEFQFYIVFIVIIWALQKLLSASDNKDCYDSYLFHVAFLAIGVVSLVDYFDLLGEGGFPGLFLPFWYEFYIGILVCWVVKSWSDAVYLAVFGGATLTLAVAFGDINSIICLFSAIFIYLSVLGFRYIPKLSGTAFQFFGRISYSLYLFHPMLGWSMVSLVERLLGPGLTIVEVIFAFSAGVLFSIVSAYIMYRLIEYPSLQWSKMIKKT